VNSGHGSASKAIPISNGVAESSQPDHRLFFVIADTANEIPAVCIDPGVFTHSFRRQFPVTDRRN
jgi:hypothetical protein